MKPRKDIMQICSNLNCHMTGTAQILDNFQFRKDTKTYRKECKDCSKKRCKEFYYNNKVYLLKKEKQYRIDNKKIIQERRKRYSNANKLNKKEYDKNYYQNNRIKIIKATSKYKQDKRNKNTIVRLKDNISHIIREALKRNKTNKNGISCLKYLSYTIKELKLHLESKFEVWMNWNNYGTYVKSKWNDDDQTTWTWQIDHIVPHSTFQYSSMEDEEFKKCWVLDNLRPLSSKQNLLDGNRR